MSTIDPGILQGIRPPMTPLQRQQQDMALQDQQAQMQERQQNAERLRQQNLEARTKYNEGQSVRAMVQTKQQANQPITAADFLGAAPVNGDTWAKAYFTNQASEAAQRKQQLDQARELHGLLASHLNALKGLPPEQRQPVHDQWIQQNADILGNEAAGLRNEDLTDSGLSTALAQATPLEKQLEEAHKTTDEKIKQSELEIKRLEANTQAANAERARFGVSEPFPAAVQAQKIAEKQVPQPPMSSERFTQEKQLTQEKADLGTEKARLAAGNDTRLANVPTNLHKDVLDKVQKTEDELTTAQQAADDMKTFIDMARSGNKVAYSYAPTEGVLTFNTGRGVKRVNMAEIQSYSGAGSAVDKIKGWLGKQTSGASIPADVLNDMASLHAAVVNNAQTARDRKLQSIDKTYRSSFSGTASPGTVKMKAPNGQVKDVPADQVAHYKSLGAVEVK